DLAMSTNPDKDQGCWQFQNAYEKRIRDAFTYNSYNKSYFSIEEYEGS
ncbi:7588_t:CDS:2, partial [Scutellospora calospora]